MKITDVRWMLLKGPRPHDLGGEVGTSRKMLVRVDTDAGIYGLGECDNFPGIRDGLGYCRAVMLGRDPLELRPMWSEIVYGTVAPHPPSSNFAGRDFPSEFGPCAPMSPTATPDGPPVWAVSGVEIALVDLIGKALKTPAYNVFGGAFRKEVPVYLDRSSPSDQENLDAWRKMASDAAMEGFGRMKFDIDYMAPRHVKDVWNRTISAAQMIQIVKRLEAAREAAGDEVEIAVDGHMQYNLPDSVRLAQELAHLKLAWVEDLMPITNVDAYRQLRAKSPSPVCVGEMFTMEQFRTFVDHEAADILHPDVMFCGGMHELHRIGLYADSHYLPLAMHGNGGALATIAAAHVAAATRNFLSLEYHFIEARWIGEFVRREGLPLFRNGCVPVSDAPGLGVEIDERVCRENLAPGEKMF